MRKKKLRQSPLKSGYKYATMSIACFTLVFPGSPLTDFPSSLNPSESPRVVSTSRSHAKSSSLAIIEETDLSPEPNMSDLEYMKLRKSLNSRLGSNFKRLMASLKTGGAEELFENLRDTDREKGGYITISSSGEVTFRIVTDPDDIIFTNLIDAIENEQPIPDQEKTLQTVIDVARGYLPGQPEKYAQAIVLFDSLRKMQRNPEQEKLYQKFHSGIPDVIRILRDNTNKRADLFVQRPDYAFEWHHHTFTGEKKPPSTRDKNNSLIGPPSIVLELRDNGLIVHAIRSGTVQYSEPLDFDN